MIDHGQGGYYRIRVRGVLDQRWADWFNGLSFQVEISESGEQITLLTGRIQDQSALQGILKKLIDLNLPLLGVEVDDIEEES